MTDTAKQKIKISFLGMNMEEEEEGFEEKITVKFFTDNPTEVFTHSFNNKNNIAAVKKLLEPVFSTPCEKLAIYKENEELRDKDILGNFKINLFGIIQLKVVSKDDQPLKLAEIYQKFVVPDIITVKIEGDDGEEKEVVVEIENRAIPQPALGCYKNTKTGEIFVNNITQTGPPPPKIPVSMQSNRDTQTYFTRNRKIETTYSTATQMSRTELYIPSITDRILTPGPYETAEERDTRLDIDGKVRIIQRYYRAWKILKELKKLHEDYQNRIKLQEEEEEQERRDDAARRRRDVVSKVFPINLTDFAMLYTMTERWKKTEIARISSMHCGPSKIAELYLLLEKEIEILSNLEKLKHKVNDDMQVQHIINYFKQLCSPIDWYSSYKNIHIFMDTLETQKAREYFALYKKLCDKEPSKEERLSVYMEVKEYLNEHPSNESEEIKRHIDRMCVMMARGMEAKFLKMLEIRIESLVLHHIQHINPLVKNHYQKLQQKKIGKDLMYCQRCQRIKSLTSFSKNSRTTKIKICLQCAWLDKAEEPWVDLLPYRYILKQIRNFERRHRASSSIAFILQDKDIHFIINNIWHGHSALSECNDIYELRLCRWRVDQEWSPWNCILLTMEEAKSHLRIVSLEEVYEKEFFNHVFNKHALAKSQFSQLTVYDKHFTEMTKGDVRLDETSSFYNKEEVDCPFGEMQ